MEILNEFLESLRVEEERFIPQFRADALGVILRSAIGELDLYHYNLKKSGDSNDVQHEQLYILKLGVVRLIQLSLDTRDSFDVPVLTFKRRRDISLKVLNIVSALGIIEHGRRVAQTLSLGVGDIQKGDDGEYLFILPEKLTDDEYYERNVLQYYYSESEEKLNKILKLEMFSEAHQKVSSLLHDLVYPFNKDYIGYGADPVLDEYFFGLAYHKIQLNDGFDSFHYSTKFGGVRFQSYILALTYFLSNYIRHERFCETLIKKDPTVKLENILTITTDTDGFVESIRDSVNYFGSFYEEYEEIDLHDAKIIFNTLSCGRDSTGLISQPGAPLPLIVRSSEEGFIRCQTGAFTEPVRFLLESLRYHYPKDYDKNQRTRESSMQKAIRRVLNDVYDDLIFRDNIKVKVSGKILTDIDLVVLDKKTGVLFLCQLKHQELYGGDLKARRVRTERLKDQSSKWLSAVDNWLEISGGQMIRNSLRVPKETPPLQIYRLVITKHFSYPLKDIVPDDYFAYATWPQFFNATILAKNKSGDCELSSLINILRKHYELSDEPTYMPEPSSEWILGNLKFITRQDEELV